MHVYKCIFLFAAPVQSMSTVSHFTSTLSSRLPPSRSSTVVHHGNVLKHIYSTVIMHL